MEYRKLSKEEQVCLEKQGCLAEDWNKVHVTDPFQPERVRNTHFSGEVFLGVFEKSVDLCQGVQRPTGLYNSSIHNSFIGDNVYISDLKICSSYRIGPDVIIENVGSLVLEGESSFGNGTVLEVLNEGGGRGLAIFDRLTSQMAYFMVLYRHKQQMIKNLEKLISDHVRSKRSSFGLVGKGSRIINCVAIKNTSIGPAALLSGVLHLENGSVASTEQDPCFIGEGVVAKDFIILSGTRIESSVLLNSCFVGQGVRMGKQFSAENSAFFANCEGFHGEAVSVLAGPYTVTHHKSTLLIAGLFSFYNAGSGTNQSNHRYKLGPVHQGILERGAKTGSFSYLLWPCRVGAFSVVIGKHYSNFDTSEFPFSYISEESGRSVLTPGMNLFTAGTRRDSVKWPSRDRRRDPDKLDLIHFEIFNPYTIGRMIRGVEILKDLLERSSRDQDHVLYKGIHMKRLLLKASIKYYEMAIRIYLGQCLLARMKRMSGSGSLFDLFSNSRSGEISEWLDIAGLLAPAEKIEALMLALEKDEVKDLDDLKERFQQVYERYEEEEWEWCLGLIQKRLNIAPLDLTVEHLQTIISDWKENLIKLDQMILRDAEKEFDRNVRIGFGIDGDAKVQEDDFSAVRGSYEKNKFVSGLEEEIRVIQRTAEEMREGAGTVHRTHSRLKPLSLHASDGYALDEGLLREEEKHKDRHEDHG